MLNDKLGVEHYDFDQVAFLFWWCIPLAHPNTKRPLSEPAYIRLAVYITPLMLCFVSIGVGISNVF